MPNRTNILGETLDGLGRWYLTVPPVLMVVLLVTFLFVTGGGQARLQRATSRLQVAASREHAIDDLDDALLRAQGSLRGYQLTDESRYLEGYRLAVADVGPRFAALRQAYGGAAPQPADVDALRGLIDRRLGEFSAELALHDGAAPERSLAIVKSESGVRTARGLAAAIERLRQRESLEQVEAARHWESSLRLSRWFTAAGALLSVLLMGVTTRLVYKDLRRRALQTAQLRDQKSQLEREVGARTRELVELSTHLQSVAEREKESLARELHDELGGLLVGARMDVSWVERHIGDGQADMRQRLERVQQTLSAGVDLKRRIIEELRPTLLDNVGLFAALRWQLKETCGRAGIQCAEYFPDEEPQFASPAAIALFRIAQESFMNIIKHARATRVEVALDLDEGAVVLRIADDGVGISHDRFQATGAHGLAAMRHRVRALEGRFEVGAGPSGGTVIVARIPVTQALRAEPLV